MPHPPATSRNRDPRTGSRTTHAIKDGSLGQLDLPVRPGFLTAVRTVEANVPFIARDWLISYPSAVTFTVTPPEDLTPGTVVAWEDRQGGTWEDWLYTAVTAAGSQSVTFVHAGRGPDGALEAARRGSDIRRAAAEAPRGRGNCR